jgi:hypothetical protein
MQLPRIRGLPPKSYFKSGIENEFKNNKIHTLTTDHDRLSKGNTFDGTEQNSLSFGDVFENRPNIAGEQLPKFENMAEEVTKPVKKSPENVRLRSATREPAKLDLMHTKIIDSFDKTFQEIRTSENDTNFFRKNDEINQFNSPSGISLRFDTERDRISKGNTYDGTNGDSKSLELEKQLETIMRPLSVRDLKRIDPVLNFKEDLIIDPVENIGAVETKRIFVKKANASKNTKTSKDLLKLDDDRESIIKRSPYDAPVKKKTKKNEQVSARIEGKPRVQTPNRELVKIDSDRPQSAAAISSRSAREIIIDENLADDPYFASNVVADTKKFSKSSAPNHITVKKALIIAGITILVGLTLTIIAVSILCAALITTSTVFFLFRIK